MGDEKQALVLTENVKKDSMADFRAIQWDTPPQLAEIGKIKIGGKGEERTSKKGEKYRLPVFTDHFLICRNERDAQGNLLPDKKLMDKIGDHCQSLDVVLLFDDISLSVPQFLAYYRGKNVFCRGNGKFAERIIDEKTGKRQRVECPCEFLNDDEKGNSRCTPHTILSCILPIADQIGGVFTFRSSGYGSCKAIKSSLMLIQSLTNGIIARIPLKLRLQMITKTTKAGTFTVPVVTIVYEGKAGDDRPAIDQLYEHALKIAQHRTTYSTQIAKLEELRRKALEAPETLEAIVDVVEEFQPQNQPALNDDSPQNGELDAKIDELMKKTGVKPEQAEILKKNCKDKLELVKKLEEMIPAQETQKKPEETKDKGGGKDVKSEKKVTDRKGPLL